MVRPCLWGTIGLLVASLATGCFLPEVHRREVGVGPGAPVGPDQTVLPFVPRDDSQADPELAPPTPGLTPTGARAIADVPHRGLDAQTCRCLAAQNSSVGQMLDARQRHLAAEEPHHLCGNGSEPARNLLGMAMALEAQEARNLASGTALEMFYRLAQAEAQADLLRQSRAEVDAALQSAEVQLERGLPVQQVHDGLLRQQIELRSQDVDLYQTIDRLGNELKGLLSLGPADESWHLWPLMTWTTDASIPDPDSAIALGLERRPQLRLLRALIERLDERTMFLANGMFAAVNPLLAIDVTRVAPNRFFCATVGRMLNLGSTDGVDAMRGRLVRLLEWRQKTIADDIRRAVVGIESALLQANIARDGYAVRKRDLDRLQAKAQRGLTSNLEISTAKLEQLKARGLWIEQVILWNIAHVRLEQAQGVLVDRCKPSMDQGLCSPRPGQPAGAAPH